MTFAQLKSFYLAATLGTFAQAAERLNTTQPAVSARIAALERELGVRLFDRTGHRVALTPEGRSFLASAEKLLEVQAQAINQFGNGRLTGTLRIGAADTMAITWFPDFLSRLREDHPQVSIEVHIGPTFRLREQLLTRQIDVGFVNGPLSDSEMINELLCDCPMVLAAAPALNLHGRRISASQLEPFDVFTFERMTRPYNDIHRRLRARELRVRLSPISSLQTIILFMLKGLGVGAVPMCVIAQELADGRLVALDTDLEPDEIRFTASYPQGPGSHVGESLTRLATTYLRQAEARPGIKIFY